MTAIAILHPTNLLGKELRETIERETSWTDVRLLSTKEDEAGALTEVGGAAALVKRYEPGDLDGITTAFFCGPIKDNRAVLAELPAGATGIVLSPDATLDDGRPVVAGINTQSAGFGGVLLSPHPAVVLLAHLLRPLAALDPQGAVVTVLQPASMAGDPGIEELFEQTRQIIAMTRRTPSPVFGAQLAFNLMPTSLPADPLAAMLAAVLGGPPPVSVQVVQAGVFHSLAVSLNVRLGAEPSVQAVRKALSTSPYLEVADDAKHLGPIDAAASEKVIFGTVRKAADGSFWLWAVMDNLTRGGAVNAVEVAQAVS